MEIWKHINGYDDYQISNLGRVKSLKYDKEIILNSSFDSYGYKCISLYKNNKGKYYKVHRLIAIAFIPNPENKPFIDHINKNRSDNSLNNLRWVTHQENMCNLPIKKSNILQQQYISPIKYRDITFYRVQITRNKVKILNKTVKTLDDAIQVRDNFLKDYIDETV